MPNYSNGKIYKITGGGLTYIGSTTQKLSYRLSGHRAEKKSKPCSNVSSFQILDFDDCCITLIEDVPCERREQLLMRERYHIENTKCVNKLVPLRTIKEYHESNKDFIFNQKMNWMSENKENIIIKRREYYNKNKEKIAEIAKQCREKDREKINEQKRLYLKNNKEKINQQRREKYALKKLQKENA